MFDVNTLPMLIAEKAKQQPDFPVLTFECDGQETVRTYGQLWCNGVQVAAALSERGVRAGDRLAIVLHNCPEFVETMIGAGILGAIFVPLDPDAPISQIERILGHAACCGAVCGDASASALVAYGKRTTALHWLMVLGDSARLPDGPLRIDLFRDACAGAAAQAPALRTNGQDPMQILYKTDSSDPPVGIVIRHGRFIRLAKGGELHFGYRPSERPYTALSLAHSTAQFITLAPALKMGLRAFIGRRFAKDRLWSVMRQYGCTTFSLVGGMAAAIYCEPPDATDADNPVRFVVSAGMPKAMWLPFAQRFDVQILEFYGTTEGGMTINPIGAGPAGSCGRVAPGLAAKVVDANDQEVPANTLGEIRFRPANRTQPVVEYYNNQHAAEEKTRGGWLGTDDLVTMDENDWVYFQCRKGSGITRNGTIVDTSETLRVLAECPGVDDASLFGVPSTSDGGDPDLVAAVVPRRGTTLDAAALLAWCQCRLDKSITPAYIMEVPALPKTTAQRVIETVLVEQFLGRSMPVVPRTDIASDRA